MTSFQNPRILVRSIKQKDNMTFTIKWADGKQVDYRLSDVQKLCPCANCKENKPAHDENPDVRAVKITSVGRYALRMQFTSGCSSGIYGFDMLYAMSKHHG